MSTTTIGFAVSDEDREVLDELVNYFGDGNRSAYLRATFKIMKAVKLTEEWRELQAKGQQHLAARGLTTHRVAEITHRILKGQ